MRRSEAKPSRAAVEAPNSGQPALTEPFRIADVELGPETETIATGGLAEHIVPFTEEIDDTDDLLTLTGLRLLHERNA